MPPLPHVTSCHHVLLPRRAAGQPLGMTVLAAVQVFSFRVHKRQVQYGFPFAKKMLLGNQILYRCDRRRTPYGFGDRSS